MFVFVGGFLLFAWYGCIAPFHSPTDTDTHAPALHNDGRDVPDLVDVPVWVWSGLVWLALGKLVEFEYRCVYLLRVGVVYTYITYIYAIHQVYAWACLLEDPLVLGEPALVHEVVVLDAREGLGVLGVIGLADGGPVGE